MAELIRCDACGHENAPGHRFCSMCGTALATACSRCGIPAPAGARFCGSCGAELSGTDAAQAALEPLEERRVATVVFADLSGFTNLSGRTDPEEVRALVDRCMTLLGEIVGRFGGTVDKIIGDAVLAVWGVPLAQEDHAERAVRAALEMQRCAREHAGDFSNLSLRIGVNTGEVMFAPVGPQQQRQQTVIGDVVNIASRLQTSAPREGILVGEETWRATRRAIRYEGVEPFTVKGRDAPLDAWLAVDVVDVTPAERQLSDVPMVGREHELEVLERTWHRVVEDRRPHFVVVLGPGGIGKSRLCRELRESIEGSGVTVLKGRSSAYGESTPYGAFASMVKQAAAIYDTDDPEKASEKLERRILTMPWRGDPAAAFMPLQVLTGLGPGELDNRTVVFDAAQRLVEALGTERPTLIGFEDLHWADRSLLDLVEHLAARVRDIPVLILATARPTIFDERPGLGGGLPAYTALYLDALSEGAADQLTHEVLRGRNVAPRVLERIAEAAGGNPLFIEELSASIAEGTIDPARGLPASVVSIIAARFDGLPASERRLLLSASVIGRTFWRSLLHELDPETDLDTALAELELREFIRREPVSVIAADDAYSFRHMSLREVAYNTLPKAERRQRHGVVARSLEAYPTAATALAPIVAYHWREAGDADRAIDFFESAAEQADQAWAKQEAVNFYTQILDLLPADDPRRRSFSLRRAVAFQTLGHIASGDAPRPAQGPGPRGAESAQMGKSAGETSPPIS